MHTLLLASVALFLFALLVLHPRLGVRRAAAMGAVALAAVVVLSSVTACGGTHPVGPVIGGAVVDCLGEGRDAIDAVKDALKQIIFGGGKPDWAAVQHRAWESGKRIGGCAIAEVVQDYLGGLGVPESAAEGNEANAALESFRTEHADGATFHTVVNGKPADL